MKSNFLIKIVIILLMTINQSNFVFSAGSASYVHGLVQVLKPEFIPLSPAWGAMLFKMGYCEELIKSLPNIPETKNTLKLAKEVFYYNEATSEFNVSQHPLKAFSYFTPEIIGKIINTIVTSKNLKKDLEKIITTKNLAFQPNTQEIQSFYKNQITRLTNALELNKSSVNLEKDLEKTQEISRDTKLQENTIKGNCKAFITSLIGALGEEQIFQKDFNQIKESIDELEEEKKMLLATKENIKDNADKRRIEKNIQKKIKDIREKEKQLKDSSEKYFYKNHTIHILLSGLWQKINNKQELLEYFNNLDETFFVNKTQINELLNKNFTKEDYFEFTNTTKTPINELINLSEKNSELPADNIEKLAFIYLGVKNYQSPLPNEILTRLGVKYKNSSYSNCGEISILNFLNALIFDNETREFVIFLLKKLNPNSTIINFYKNNHSTVENMRDTPDLHEELAPYLSDLPQIKYATEENTYKCAIGAGSCQEGMQNILFALSYLFNKNFKSFNDLQTFINEKLGPKISIEFSEPKIVNNNLQKININLTKNDIQLKLIWEFHLGHLRLKYPTETIFSDYNTPFKGYFAFTEFTQYDGLIPPFDYNFIFLMAYETNYIENAFYRNLAEKNLLFLIHPQNISEKLTLLKQLKFPENYTEECVKKILNPNNFENSPISWRSIFDNLSPKYWIDLYEKASTTNKELFLTSAIEHLKNFQPNEELDSFVQKQMNQFNPTSDFNGSMLDLILSSNQLNLTWWFDKLLQNVPPEKLNSSDITTILKSIIHNKYSASSTWMDQAMNFINQQKFDANVLVELVKEITINNFKPAFNWIKTTLEKTDIEKIQDTGNIKEIAHAILTYPTDLGYKWAVNALKTIDAKYYSSSTLIESIINNKITAGYGLIPEMLNNLKFNRLFDIISIIQLILENEFKAGYFWIKNALKNPRMLNLSNESKEELIKTLIDHNFEDGFYWIKNVLKNIIPEELEYFDAELKNTLKQKGLLE